MSEVLPLAIKDLVLLYRIPWVEYRHKSCEVRHFTMRRLLIYIQNESKDRDNEDNCAACGGTGALLCCDSCIRSFHFTCLEPPQDAENAPEGKWYCRACIAQQHDRAVRSGNDFEEDPREIVPDVDGVFKPLFTKLHGKTEHSYTLPKVVAEAFEGVKMGETGEYEEPGLPRNRLVRNL